MRLALMARGIRPHSSRSFIMQTFTTRPRAALALILFGTALVAAGCDRRPSDPERSSTMGTDSSSRAASGPAMSSNSGTAPAGGASAAAR
jgi:hypothetical protein